MIRRMVLVAWMLPLLLAAGSADAQNVRKAREELEMSLLVRGHADIDREGRITAHALEQPDQLPGYVVDLVADSMPQLRFEPVLVDGMPVLARAKMTLRVVAQRDGDNMRLGFRSMHFGEEHTALPEEERVTHIRMDPPRYPTAAVRVGGQGTVYLLVKVGRDGLVEEVVVEQTNLATIGTARQMDLLRNQLEQSSLTAARTWRFAPPTTGEDADRDFWALRVPVQYSLDDKRKPRYGQWVAYHPGERIVRPDWAPEESPGFNPDLLAAGTAHSADSKFRLLNPPES